MGGPSSEHEVSLNSGESVFIALDRKKFIPTRLIISKDWKLTADDRELKFPAGLKRYDVIFIALHGVFGEDGVVQTILDSLDIPYTGSGAVASWLGMDKWFSAELFKKAGISVPKSYLIRSRTDLPGIRLPFVLKPRRGGSSVGVEIVKARKEIKRKSRQAFKHENELIGQEYVKGKEFTCGIVERNGRPRVLPVVEIRPKKNYEFFDYEAKYITGASEEIVPAPVSKRLTQEIQTAALRAHRAIGCSSYSRSDFIVRNGTPYILEINTLPGLTENSLIPKSSRAGGIPFPELLETIVASAFYDFRKKSTTSR